MDFSVEILDPIEPQNDFHNPKKYSDFSLMMSIRSLKTRPSDEVIQGMRKMFLEYCEKFGQSRGPMGAYIIAKIAQLNGCTELYELKYGSIKDTATLVTRRKADRMWRRACDEFGWKFSAA